MSTLQQLTAARDELLAKIRAIEENCEGLENEHNAARAQELNLEQAKYNAQKKELSAQLTTLEQKMSAISTELSELAGTGIDRILDAIKNQKWYFFKNKPHVLMDKLTGILWANLDYFPYLLENGAYSSGSSIVDSILNDYIADGFENWQLPTRDEILYIVNDNTFPFSSHNQHRIKDYGSILYDTNGMWLDRDYPGDCNGGLLLPCDHTLVKGSEYANNISSDNNIYSEKERLQFTLDLFTQNELWPIFNDEAITDLYKKIYFEKPRLIAKLQEVQAEIDAAQSVELISSDFDYTLLLSRYDIKAIDGSVIKYYKAVQGWIDELMDRLEHYEAEKESLISDFNAAGLNLSAQYKDNVHLTAAENRLMAQRQQFCQQRFTLGLNGVKERLLNVRAQADALEDELDAINGGSDSISALAKLEARPRAGFALLAENTAEILKSALVKMDFFEANRQLVADIVAIWEGWTEDYKVFATKRLDEFRQSCEGDGIAEDVYGSWCEDWRKLRFAIEKKVQPLIKRSLAGDIPMMQQDKGQPSVVLQLINVLKHYKQDIDAFYFDGRKSIYQKYAFIANGDLQDKFETESELYKRTFKFQKALQDIIFNCQKAADRIFILKWAGDLLDLQVDEILQFVADRDLSVISQAVLDDFAALKRKNYEAYLNDAKAYGKEQARREKEYNSLVFKMRQGLKKLEQK